MMDGFCSGFELMLLKRTANNIHSVSMIVTVALVCVALSLVGPSDCAALVSSKDFSKYLKLLL